ncbi:MAG: hypothetical protein J7641_11250 [Cyanobacteria bacterium SID2]|nr:hypothetical protein [Cyanobacteria bacterium SID2]MBP0005712.1 hypothetical protein [Cyanobacteria bacterium SBC]
MSWLKLINTNDYQILDTVQFPQPDREIYQSASRSQCNADSPEVRWLTYTIIKEDTNGDGKLSDPDLITLAISDADGQNYTELLFDLKRLYGLTLTEEQDRLIIIYLQNNRRKISVVDLFQYQVLSTEDLPGL